jgi:hypothetical protein
MASDAKTEWDAYYQRERAGLVPVLTTLGFTLDEKQIHTSGERYLLGGRKLVLTGTRTNDGRRVILKASSDASGIKEIEHEHACRVLLDTLAFAYSPFSAPEQLAFTKRNGYGISVIAFIEEERPFLTRTTEEQFMLVLRAFKMQEDVQAATYSHERKVRAVFGLAGVEKYLADFSSYVETIRAACPENNSLEQVLTEASAFLSENKLYIEQYCGFLTHTDFVPHNFRLHKDEVYLLDNASLRFGSKHESWARLINYMALYNRDLESYLTRYVRENRSEEEYLSLRLMRIFKLGFLIAFYAKNLEKTSGDLRTLSESRIEFWTEVLRSVLKDQQISESILANYKHARNSLRSEDEKTRQRALSQL